MEAQKQLQKMVRMEKIISEAVNIKYLKKMVGMARRIL